MEQIEQHKSENPGEKFAAIADEVGKIFTSGGSINERKSDFEYRYQQENMALGVNDSFRDKKHFICEAPTGSGKSFAYLAPAMLAARDVPGVAPVIVATGTIALQEQIVKKDAPFLQDIIPNVDVVLAKGRSNYLCPYRFAKNVVPDVKEAKKTKFKTEEQEAIVNLANWATETASGDKTEIEFDLPPYIWMKACSKTDDCDQNTCKEFCYVREAKKRLKAAHVIIANHHLLFADLQLRRDTYASALPDCGYLIIDEAHKIEDVATDYLSNELSNLMVRELLDDSYNPDSSRRHGVVRSIYMNINIVDQQSLERDFVPQYEAMSAEYKRFFSKLYAWVVEKKAKRIRDFNAFKEYTGLEKFQNALKAFKQSLRLVDAFATKNKGNYDKETLKELGSVISRTDKFLDMIERFCEFKEENVFFVEKTGSEKRQRVSLKTQPIDVSEILKEELFERKESIILTSATLSTDGDFAYIRKRIGLEDGYYQGILAPVFDYQRQVEMFIPSNMPNPKKDGYEVFNKAVIEVVRDLLLKHNGKAFVLFTSYSLLNAAKKELEAELKKNDITLLCQGNGVPTGRLIQRFKDDVTSVLFGTDTFWEGIDIPGEALSNLIITKLPFVVPDDPITEARLEYIDQHGGNSFFDYSVPKAVIKLKQGFGRLIRRKTDTGTCSILDPRVLKTGYGRVFLRSLPQCRMVEGF